MKRFICAGCRGNLCPLHVLIPIHYSLACFATASACGQLFYFAAVAEAALKIFALEKHLRWGGRRRARPANEMLLDDLINKILTRYARNVHYLGERGLRNIFALSASASSVYRAQTTPRRIAVDQ